jgi:phosphoribosylcarboxyaminoimidazole (NCAIR) mutase
MPLVGILMGSESDMEVMKLTAEVLDGLGISSETRVMSAHRNPGEVMEYASGAAGRGLRVLVAGAGLAAHLAGALAANTCRLPPWPSARTAHGTPAGSPPGYWRWETPGSRRGWTERCAGD